MDDTEALGIALEKMAAIKGADAVKRLVNEVVLNNLDYRDRARIEGIIECVRERNPEAKIGPITAAKIYWQVSLYLIKNLPPGERREGGEWISKSWSDASWLAWVQRDKKRERKGGDVE